MSAIREREPFLIVERARPPGAIAHAGALLLTVVGAELGRSFWVGTTEAALIWPPAGLALGLAGGSALEGDLDLRGFLGLDPKVPKGYTDIRVRFKVKTDEKDLGKLRKLADFSPVHGTITNGAKVNISVNRM